MSDFDREAITSLIPEVLEACKETFPRSRSAANAALSFDMQRTDGALRASLVHEAANALVWLACIDKMGEGEGE